MTLVTFSDADRFKMAEVMLPTLQRSPILDASDRAADITDERIARLFARLNEDSVVLLPFHHGGHDYWLIASRDVDELSGARTRAARFLSPSYGRFNPDQAIPSKFQNNGPPLQVVGAKLFPSGYYRWESAANDRNRILDRVMLWLDLETQRPAIQPAKRSDYYQLHTAFQDALAQGSWTDAELYLSEMQQRYLATADNLAFLRIQLLGEQAQWTTIWGDSAYETWSLLSMPRKVRTLLLRAFYEEELCGREREGGGVAALEAFRRQRHRLGTLLSGPFELDTPSTVHILGYVATDEDPIRLDTLLAKAQDQKTIHILNELKQLAAPGLQLNLSPTEQTIRALRARDYATAEATIDKVENMIERTLLQLELAYFSQDEALKRKAWTRYQALSWEEQAVLQSHERFTAPPLVNLLDFALPMTTSEPRPSSANPSLGWPASIAELRRTVWTQVCELERQLRKLISSRYSSRYPENWETRIEPDEAIRTKWKLQREKDRKTFEAYDYEEPPLLDYTYLGDLQAMVNREWTLFKDIFESRQYPSKEAKKEFALKVEAITRVRNPLAHNREIPSNELKRADVFCTDLLNLLRRYSH